MSEVHGANDYKVRLSGTEEQMRAFLLERPLEPYRVEEKEGRVAIDFYVDGVTIRAAETFGLEAEILADVTAQTRRLPVGGGNRFADGQPPRGIGRVARKGR